MGYTMTVQILTGMLALAALVFAVIAFGLRWLQTQHLPFALDRSVPKGSPLAGIAYAFTLGMAPWSKESARMHWVTYLRGVAFHIGIFSALISLLASPWLDAFPYIVRVLFAVITGFGAVMGLIGALSRRMEHNLDAISTKDDHAAVWLVSLFVGMTCAALLNSALLPGMWFVAAAMLFYAPISKIRHCIFFYFGRLFYGTHVGRRGMAGDLAAEVLFLNREVPHGR